MDATIAGASGPVLLDFHADWCGPCQRQGQILHDMEDQVREAGGRVIKVNVDEHPELAGRMKVKSLPTLIAMGDGEVTQRKTGLTDGATVLSWLR